MTPEQAINHTYLKVSKPLKRKRGKRNELAR